MIKLTLKSLQKKKNKKKKTHLKKNYFNYQNNLKYV